MTSFGVEWDTSALINLALDPKPGQKNQPLQLLPPGTSEKVPFVYGDKWTLTLESINISEKHSSGNDKKDDCLYTLESQLGVFRSDDPSKFNTSEFKEVCAKFNKFWINMINMQGIVRKNKFYPVLAHQTINNADIDQGKKYFIDCQKKKPGLIEGKEGLMWAYTDLLKSMHGAPQVTVGIELKRVLSLFKFIISHFNRCMKEDTTGKPCKSMKKTWFLFGNIKKAYYNTVAQLRVMGYTKFEKIVNENITALIVLTNYYFISMVDGLLKDIKGTEFMYIKAFYILKLRSDLRVMFDTFSPSQQEFYRLWATNYFTSWKFNGLKINESPEDSELEKKNKDYINGEIKNKLIYWFYKFFINVDTAYMIFPKGDTPIMVNKIGLYSISPDQLNIIKNHADVKKVKICKADWSGNPPHIIYTDGVIKYKNSDEILGFDYMEWGIQNSNIFIEFRGMHLIYNLYRRVHRNLYEEDIRLFRSMDSEDLCKYIVKFMKIIGFAISMKNTFPQIFQKSYFLNPKKIRGLLTKEEQKIIKDEGAIIQSLRNILP